MSKLRDFYRKSSWYDVFNFENDRGKARSYLLFASIAQTIINGLTTGIFYSGYLASFGIDIVGISVLTLMPYVTSLFSMLAPMILERFKKRRLVLSASRLVYYLINIVGLTVLPLAVQTAQGRMVGLIGISFLANAINALFSSGYSAWHMGYIDSEIRFGYMTASSLISGSVSGILMLGLGAVTDRMEGQTQQIMLAALRCAGFAIALLDIYFLQKPKEPAYKTGERTRISLVSTLKIPLANKRFMLIMVVYLLYASIINMVNSIVNPWLLGEIEVSYTYINFINMTYIFFLLPTSAFWGKWMRKHGTLGTLALAVTLWVPSCFLHACLTKENYLWVMTIIKLIHNCVTLGLSISSSSLIYIALPEEDQTSYLSFYQILANVAALLGMGFGTWGVAVIGDQTINVLGHPLSAVPFLCLMQAVVLALLPGFVLWVGGKVEPGGWKFDKRHYHFPFHHKDHHHNH